MTGGLYGSGTGDEDQQLADLRWHWDLAYEINVAGETWTARFLPGTDVLSASSAEDLRRLIRADYLARTSAEKAGTGARPGPRPDAGAGERALRRLGDDGVI